MNIDPEQLKSVIEVWKKVIDVQQHFNDLALRIRNFALTAFTFIVGAAGYLVKEDINVSFGNYSLPAASIICFAGIFILIAFWYMDRYWYHNLLIGAVKQGLYIEEKYKAEFDEIGLTISIGKASPDKFFKWKIHSKHKFIIFYGIIWGTLLILGVLLLFK